jgi:hypothetical protein
VAPLALGAQLRVEASAIRGLDADLLMAEVGIHLRRGYPIGSRNGEAYFITLELTGDCWFRWTRIADGWHKLTPRVPIPR